MTLLKYYFGPQRDELRREWRKLHSEGLSDLYCSHNIVRVIKSRIMRWGGQVANRERVEVYTGFWWGNMWQRDHLGEPGVEGSIIFLVLQEVGCGGIG